jgi:hypothetical protein
MQMHQVQGQASGMFSPGSCNRYTAALRNAVQYVRPQGQLLQPTMTTAKRCNPAKCMHDFKLNFPVIGLLNYHSMLIGTAWKDSQSERDSAHTFTEQGGVAAVP